jgi:hypothetical protein
MELRPSISPMVVTFVALGRSGRLVSEKTPLEALVPFLALEWPETALMSRKSRILVGGSLQTCDLIAALVR